MAVVGRPRAVLHHPLLADSPESVGRFAPQQHDAANHECSGTEAEPDRRAEMHEVIIEIRAVDCKHSRIGEKEKGLRSCCNL